MYPYWLLADVAGIVDNARFYGKKATFYSCFDLRIESNRDFSQPRQMQVHWAFFTIKLP